MKKYLSLPFRRSQKVVFLKKLQPMKTSPSITSVFFNTAFAVIFSSGLICSLSVTAQQAEIPTVTIGNQVWMAENLGRTTFLNGDSIPRFSGYHDWHAYGSAGQPACGRENFNPSDALKYGILYNWYAVNDPRGLCPPGFRIPTDDDFIELLTFTGGEDDYDTEQALALIEDDKKGFGLWYNGWCCMDFEDDEGTIYHFVNRGYGDSYWSSTEIDGSEYYLDDIALSLELGSSWRTDTYGAYLDPTSSKMNAYSVRCIKK
jgi:uncharacterized protein (TIGR02145 family)